MRTAALALIPLAVALVAGCAGKDDGSTATGGGSTSASASPGAATSSTVRTVSVTVSDGKVSPQLPRVEVAKGQRVRIEVTTDKPDEVHVHGYDIEKATEPGKPTAIELTADIPGLFEVETHESGLLLFQLEVR